MNFRYKAREGSGRIREGSLEAADRAAALTSLQQSGLLVVELKPVGRLGLNLNAEIHLGGGGRVSKGDLSIFCGLFASLAGAGVPILQGLTVLGRQFRGKRLGTIIEAVIKAIQTGDSLSQALRVHREALPASLIYITSVAEVTGRLDEAYDLLARQFEQEDEFLRKVKSALTYPAAVLVITFGVIIFMMTVVLPTYGGMFAQMGAKMPESTLMMLAAGQAMRRFWYLIPVVALVVWLAVRKLMQQRRVRLGWERLVLRVPVFGPLSYKKNLATVCRTLATMARSGVPLLAGLSTVNEALEFLPMKEALAAVAGRVRAGDTFGEALSEQKVFDRISVEIITLGETAGNLDAMLFRVAEMAERDVATILNRLTALLEPALTVVLGGLVTGIIVPIILPMFDILGQVK